MKEHAIKMHEEETRYLPEEFFYENNSFYLAQNPNTNVPTPRNSKLAEQVHTAVEQWVHVNKGNIRSLTEWGKGWVYDIHITTGG